MQWDNARLTESELDPFSQEDNEMKCKLTLIPLVLFLGVTSLVVAKSDAQ